MVFHSVGADGQDGADLVIGFAYLYPVHYFAFTLAQPVGFAFLGTRPESSFARAVRQGLYSAQCDVKVRQQNFHGGEHGTVEFIFRAENYVKAVMSPAFVADAMQKGRSHALQDSAKGTLQDALRMENTGAHI